MKAIFLCSMKEQIPRVYGETQIAKIKESFDLDERVYGADELEALPPETEAIFSTWGMVRLTEEQIKTRLPNLKILLYAAGSVQGFARPFLNCGVKVVSGWQANAIPVTEYSVSAILLACKGFLNVLATQKAPDETKWNKSHSAHYAGIYENKVGILGSGAIGMRVIKELIKHDIDVSVYSIDVTSEQAKEIGFRLCSMEEIFSTCHVISNHIANLPVTKGIITEALLSRMQDYTTFINTGRAAQVDNEAFYRILRDNPTLTALFDVTEPEPLPADHPFWTLPNVFITPHIAGAFGNETHRMAQYVLDDGNRFLAGKPLEFEVTMKMLERMA